jgi:hypothetical protein
MPTQKKNILTQKLGRFVPVGCYFHCNLASPRMRQYCHSISCPMFAVTVCLVGKCPFFPCDILSQCNTNSFYHVKISCPFVTFHHMYIQSTRFFVQPVFAVAILSHKHRFVSPPGRIRFSFSVISSRNSSSSCPFPGSIFILFSPR